MSIRIGHASIDENGKAHGGAAGDQNGKEVCIRQWYNKPWAVVLRPKDPAVAEGMAQAMEAACANNCIGYNQYKRNTLNTEAKKVDYDLSKIETLCECDCSSLMAVCAKAAGVDIPYTNGNAPRTSTMQSVYTGTGAFEVLTDPKYLESDTYLKRGDVLLKPASHTAMALDDGAGAAVVEHPCAVMLRELYKGCVGEDVRAMQLLLIGQGYDIKYGADGEFGSYTESALNKYLKDKKLYPIDGICGSKTWASLMGR